ncbi:hypothetical protein GOP47_0014630 [Adiantum capillus-veneris]|uniref:UspA domain-containing protein n=1 Tax=Adiantum capillus-veneris TaxID=13818 RepID=A0A9D4UMP2_ADICA|nr:hypothetical protein GOP47_0014630 [Adiantum capillus-veneris]
MAVGGLNGCLERTMSREGMWSEGEATTRATSETTVSSFNSMMGEQTTAATKKKVMVVIDESRESRLAMLWALSHIVQGEDTLYLMQFLPSSANHKSAGVIFSRHNSARLHTTQERREEKGRREKVDLRPSQLIGTSLKMLCTSRRPEVGVEVMIVEGIDKGLTIVTQAKKLEASVLVLGQRRPSLLQRVFKQRSPNDEVIERCIQNAECLTLSVRKKSKHIGGYLINSRWQKNFWLLA